LIVIECEQGSAEWLQARTGKVTASSVEHAIAFLKRKGKEGREAGASSAAREAYKNAIAAEILTGQAAEHIVTKWMERGTYFEPIARAAYEQRHNLIVETVGFVCHPTIERAGASPDGLVGEDGGLEIKVPKIETHIQYMREGVLPSEYEPQVMFNLAVTGRAWWDFLSFCPEMPERHKQFRVRVPRDEERIAEINAGVIAFLAEVDELIAELNAKNPEIAEPKKEAQGTFDPQFGELGITDEELALIV
jgi:hypothetical protein